MLTCIFFQNITGKLNTVTKFVFAVNKFSDFVSKNIFMAIIFQGLQNWLIQKISMKRLSKLMVANDFCEFILFSSDKI